MYFYPLDKESERYLRELLSNKDFYNAPCFVVPSNIPASVIEELIKQGYLESENGVRYSLQGGYYCGARLTQLAKSYDEIKNKYEKQNLSHNYTINTYNFQHANFTNSPMQIATTDSAINFNFEYIDKAIEEFEKEAEKVELSKEQQEEFNDIVADIKEKSKNKSSLIKRALKGLWDFTKEIGAGVLTSYLSFKFGFN